MSRRVPPSTNQFYGVLLVTRVWGTSRATVYRHRRCGPMPDAALVAAIRELLAASLFHGEATGKSGRGCASPAFGRPSAASFG